MKIIRNLGIMLILSGIAFFYRENIIRWFSDHFIEKNEQFILTKRNEYTKDTSFEYVMQVNQYSPQNIDDLKNIYYSILNSGTQSYSFYCPKEYPSCLADVKTLANDQVVLSNINNFVHPFNSFKNIETEYDSLGKVSVTYYPVYQEQDKVILKEKVEQIVKQVEQNKSIEDKIKFFHDYIIEHTKYDVNRSDSSVVSYRSDTAYGALIEGYALCGGYTDSMALFLDYLEIPNYKVASENHVWNAVYLNEQWYHLDLTWDDPITSDGKDVIEYNFYLISTEELKELDQEQHSFNENVYRELKQ